MPDLEKVRVSMPQVGPDTARSVAAALEARWLGMGPLVKEFEERIAAFLGAPDRKVVCTNTGTAAIHLALLTAGVGPGDEVITPSFNFVADHQAIRMTGADVVLCDIREEDLGIDVEKAEALVTERTKAILPLHFAGIPCDQKGVYRLAERRGLRVVEDACHGFGSSVDGRRIGAYGDIACFSFDPVKVVTCVDGGCVVVNTSDELERLRHLRLLGIDRDTLARYQHTRAWEYDVVDQGFRYHLTDVAASVGLSQIDQVESFIASRQEVCRRYSAAFAELEGPRVLRRSFDDVSPYIYALRVPGGRRGALAEHLKARSVETGVHFVAAHTFGFFKGSRRDDMAVTDRVAQEILTLPLHSHMREDFVERVIDGVRSFFA
ncbi:MAG: DegT/DnrJ/EryC1/StrS family aminotransferase [Chloroflexota bacterium]|nr:DegT/DnrJ/EryC1/StrS family aminotransferase [Chloroflexota bacterium]